MLTFIHHPPSRKTEIPSTLIMLHGRGADEHDLFGLKEFLDPRLEIFSLRAPHEFNWGGYTWFDLNDDGSVDLEGFLRSKEEILSFISTLRTEKLFLLGFSMGAMMAYAIALTQPALCTGILALSGFAPKQIEHDFKLNALQNLHLFISHGINDPVIPVVMARATHALLSATAAHVMYKEYPMAHQIDNDTIADMAQWISPLI